MRASWSSTVASNQGIPDGERPLGEPFTKIAALGLAGEGVALDDSRRVTALEGDRCSHRVKQHFAGPLVDLERGEDRDGYRLIVTGLAVGFD